MAAANPLQPINVASTDEYGWSQWEGDWKAINANVSTAATRGTRYAFVREDNSWTISAPIDSDLAGFLLGMTPGQVITEIKFGWDDGLYDTLVDTTVMSVPKRVDNNSDVPRITVSGHGGDLTLGGA